MEKEEIDSLLERYDGDIWHTRVLLKYSSKLSRLLKVGDRVMLNENTSVSVEYGNPYYSYEDEEQYYFVFSLTVKGGVSYWRVDGWRNSYEESGFLWDSAFEVRPESKEVNGWKKI